MTHAENRGRLEAEEFSWTERAPGAIATVPDISEQTPKTAAPAQRGTRLTEILFAAACVLVELAWLGLLAYLLFARLSIFEAITTPR
jgi:hypothetical protein